MLTASVSIRVPSPAQNKRKLPASFFLMCYIVYILYSESLDRYYKGQTKDLYDRLHRHNHKYEKATQDGVPWILVWCTKKKSRSEAVLLESKLKNLTKVRLRKFIAKYKDGISDSLTQTSSVEGLATPTDSVVGHKTPTDSVEGPDDAD